MADTAGEFAQSVVRLLKEPETRQRLAGNAYQPVQARYEWSVVMPRFVGLVEDLLEKTALPSKRLSLA